VFTGLIQHVGTVAAFEQAQGKARLVIDAPAWNCTPKHGESIAVNGCCLTIADDGQPGRLVFDVIAQTLAVTTLGDLQFGNGVNLEQAVTPSSLLGGHIVQGHVDGVGVVTSVADVPGERRVRVQPPTDLLEAIIEKGSIAIDGVSLTTASLTETWFEVALIRRRCAKPRWVGSSKARV
jgi:riboflavin synthase